MTRGPRSCRVAGCEAKHQARGYCDAHWRHWKRTHPGIRVVSAETMHQQVIRTYGRADQWTCVAPGCDAPARDWTYDGRDDDELLDRHGRPYSLTRAHYEARCRSHVRSSSSTEVRVGG